MARPYTSRLRSEQAAQTRRKVVEAAATVLARDLGDFTIPGVAVEAGVSAATVERLFTNKRKLIEGIAEHYAETIGSMAAWPDRPRDVDDLLDNIPDVVLRTSRVPAGLRAAVATEAFQQLRRETRGTRLRAVESVLKPYRDRFTARELHHLRDLIVVLVSSAGLNAFTDLTGSSPEESAATMQWTIRRLLDGATDPLEAEAP